eukprot:1147923-Pelagomonas_calceolata.AAC.2
MTLPAAIPGQPSTMPPMNFFLSSSMPSSRREVRWAGHAGHLLLSYNEVPELFAHSLPHLTGTTMISGIICLACMPSFRVGGVLDGPGQPGVHFTGSRHP